MRVKGRKELLQSSIDLYLKIVSTNGIKTVEGLRKYYYDKFLQDARNGMVSVVEGSFAGCTFVEGGEIAEGLAEESTEESVKESVDFERGMDSCVDGDTVVSEEVEDISESSNDAGSVSYSADDFLKMVKSASDGNSMPGIEYASHGVFLDNILPEDVEGYIEDTPEDITEYASHGTYLDDIEVLGADEIPPENTVEYASHGVYLDDIELDLGGVFSVDEENIVVEGSDFIEGFDVEPVEDDSGTGFISELECVETDGDEFVTDISKEALDDGWLGEPNNGSVIEFPRGSRVLDNSAVVAKGAQVSASVPPTVRQFIKENPGCTVSEASKYYSNKVIQAELSKGKIYKKGGKLFI